MILGLSRVNLIMAEEKTPMSRCHHILQLLLVSAERNPRHHSHSQWRCLAGRTRRLRIASASCSTSLRPRSSRYCARNLREGQGFQPDETMLANLLLAHTEGRISQFRPPGVQTSPLQAFEDQWPADRLSAASCRKVEPADRINQCIVRSEFKIKPTAGFEDQWQFIRSQLLQS